MAVGERQIMFGVSYLRLTVIGLVLLALAATGWKLRVSGEQAGRAEVQAKWDKEKAVQVADALIASEKRRNDEKALNITNQGITNAYLKEKSRLVAAERVTAGRLRDLQAAVGSESRPDSAPLGGSDDPRPAIISQCATALAILDNDFTNLAAKTTALQNFSREMLIKP